MGQEQLKYRYAQEEELEQLDKIAVRFYSEREKQDRYICAVLGNEIRGFLCVASEGGKEVKFIYTDGRHRGEGISRQLLAVYQKLLRTVGNTQLKVRCIYQRERAADIYGYLMGLGFENYRVDQIVYSFRVSDMISWAENFSFKGKFWNEISRWDELPRSVWNRYSMGSVPYANPLPRIGETMPSLCQ